MLKAYGLERDLKITIPGLNGELLIIFLLQQAPKDGLKGGSNKALTQLKIVKKYSWAAPTRQAKGELEIRASCLCRRTWDVISWPFFASEDAQFICVPDVRGELRWKEVWQDGAAWDVWVIYALWVVFTPALIALFGKTFIIRRTFFTNNFSCTL